jgi:hypothetical protein
MRNAPRPIARCRERPPERLRRPLRQPQRRNRRYAAATRVASDACVHDHARAHDHAGRGGKDRRAGSGQRPKGRQPRQARAVRDATCRKRLFNLKGKSRCRFAADAASCAEPRNSWLNVRGARREGPEAGPSGQARAGVDAETDASADPLRFRRRRCRKSAKFLKLCSSKAVLKKKGLSRSRSRGRMPAVRSESLVRDDEWAL